jgi:DNA-binding CsgD family transcriptional regulator
VVTVSLESTPNASTIAPPTWPGLADALRARGLTRREAEVAHLLAQRLTNSELGAALGVSPHTAKRHTERVLANLAIHSRRGIAAALSGAGAGGPPAPSLTR